MSLKQESDLQRSFIQQTYDVQNIFAEFKKDIFKNTFFNNLDVLRSNSSFVKFDNSRWEMRPWIFCNDFYDISGYYPVILLVNNVNTFFEFLPDLLYGELIIVPTESTILKVLSYSSDNLEEEIF